MTNCLDCQQPLTVVAHLELLLGTIKTLFSWSSTSKRMWAYKVVWLLSLAIACRAEEANKAEESNNVTWTWPPTAWTLPPEITHLTDWTPGGPFPTLPPGYTLLPPELIEDAQVTIEELGTIQGAVSFTSPVTSPNSRRFFWFAGIPYADPDSYTNKGEQNNRFKPSKIWEGKPLPPNQNGKFSAINPLIWCPQGDVLKSSMDLGDVLQTYRNYSRIQTGRKSAGIKPTEQGVEDCLVININTPRLPREGESTDLLPVILFIHGGSFDLMWGGIFGGHRFLNRDVVLVTVNYRLGVLGSLNLGIDDAPGNAAMYDIITSLKWIKKHIHHFGGDKNRVTVTGHSAGAVIASHLLTSPLSIDEADGTPLLHGIIGMSGSSLSQWATCKDPITHHLRVSYYAGCYENSTETPDFQAIRDCMANKTIPELLSAMDDYSDIERLEGRLGFDAKTPSLQDPSKLSNGFKVFMPETPYDVVTQGKQLNIPLMMGAARHDGTFVMEDTYDKFLKRNNLTTNPVYLRNELLPTLISALGVEDKSGELIHALGNLYIGEKALYLNDFESKIPGLIDIHSVFGFKAGAYNLVELHSKKNKGSYYFSFEHRGLWTEEDGEVIPGGVGHIEPVFYLFQALPLVIPKDQSVAYRFTDYWVNFATYGNPNGEGKRQVAPPYNPLNHAYLIIDGFDRTGYYCRDSWVNNSLEIMKNSPTELPTDTTLRVTTSETGSTDTQTGTTTTTPVSTTPGSDTSSSDTVIVSFFAVFITIIVTIYSMN